MDNKIYKCSSLDECLDNAADELNIQRDKLDYSIIEQKKGLFKKYVVISVKIPNESTNDKGVCNTLDGTVEVVKGKVVVTDPDEGGKPACIAPSSKIRLLIDGVQVYDKSEVYEQSKIEVGFEQNEPDKNCNVCLSSDKMQAYIDIQFIPQIVYILRDSEKSNFIVLEPVIKEKIYSPPYTIGEINQVLTSKNVTSCIIEDNFKKCCEQKSVENLLIAEGKRVVDDENDYIEFKIDINQSKKPIEEDNGTIDFKSIGFISAVKSGQVIAVKHKGRPGVDGCDVTGKTQKRKTGKNIKLNVGEGCKLADDNTVVALIDGKPCIKGTTFYVYSVHEVMKDVDLSTGNIKFIGDIVVNGSVKEGMKLEAGNSITVNNNVENAQIFARGNIDIKQNVIQSSIIAGGEDVSCLTQINNLNTLKENLNNLIDNMCQIKQYNLLGENLSDGEIVKVLLENKFKQYRNVL